jgi:hypothetical protein
MPLDLLDQRVDRWVAEQAAADPHMAMAQGCKRNAHAD